MSRFSLIVVLMLCVGSAVASISFQVHESTDGKVPEITGLLVGPFIGVDLAEARQNAQAFSDANAWRGVRTYESLGCEGTGWWAIASSYNGDTRNLFDDYTEAYTCGWPSRKDALEAVIAKCRELGGDKCHMLHNGNAGGCESGCDTGDNHGTERALNSIGNSPTHYSLGCYPDEPEPACSASGPPAKVAGNDGLSASGEGISSTPSSHDQDFDPVPSQRSPSADVPLVDDLRADGSLQLAELNVDFHMYRDQADSRFVFINGKKYYEKSRLAEGPVISQITRDGVILEYAGKKFLLPNDSYDQDTSLETRTFEDRKGLNRPTQSGEAIFEQSSMQAGGELIVDSAIGSVEIIGWSKNQIEVTGEKGAKSRLNFSVGSDQKMARVDIYESNVIVHVPNLTRISAKSVAADIYVSDISGSITVETSTGDVRVNLASYNDTEYKLETFNGNIAPVMGREAKSANQHGYGLSLKFTEGTGSRQIQVDSMTGEIVVTATKK